MKNISTILGLVACYLFMVACNMGGTNNQGSDETAGAQVGAGAKPTGPKPEEVELEKAKINEARKAKAGLEQAPDTSGWVLVPEDQREKSPPGLTILSEAKKGPIKISVTQGSVVNNPGVEAIANAASSSMRGGGAIDAVILKFAETGETDGGKGQWHSGPIVDASQKHMIEHGMDSVPEGEAFSVDAGPHFAKIGVKKIIQVNGTKKQDIIAQYNANYNAMDQAAKAGVTSVGIPGISTNIFGFEKKLAARIYVIALLDYIRNNPTGPLKHIRFIDIKPEMVSEVVKALEAALKK